MTLQLLAGIGIGLAVLLAMLRIGMRRPALLGLQLVAGLALYFTLFPPMVEHEAESLLVATAGTTATQLSAHARGAKLPALPEAPLLADVERVPDLATALRRLPPNARLRILGDGLVQRDIDAARGRALAFEPKALPRGFIEVIAPSQVTVGTHWSASGTINSITDATVELLDPSGAVVMRGKADAQGRFTLGSSAPAPGRMRYGLRVRDAKGRAVDSVNVDMQAVEGSKPRVLMMAGGPGPELKYLRRWAMDAGVQLRTQVSLGGGLRLVDAPVVFDAATLQGFDLVVLDERAWRELGESRRAVLREAVANGLGVLLRITGPLSGSDISQLRSFGLDVKQDDAPTTVTLAGVAEETPSLVRQPVRVAAGDAQSLLVDASGKPLAAWRNVGRGRVGLWWLGDSFRLVLSGQASRHGRAWSEAFTTLARANAEPSPVLVGEDPRIQQRLVLCRLRDGATVIDARGDSTRLVIDAATAGKGCAAYWPSTPGWHRVRSGDAAMDWVVRDANEAPGLSARRLRDQTLALVATDAVTTTVSKTQSPGPRWPWFVGWLMASGLGWWLERRWMRRVRNQPPVG
ncbi:MAG: hypothetical protein A3E01_19570 [Gammaproteobacteria bacterium RIFCSPHIGHO2_12_FULL_63_22]|nr:MAG: hypothetical protein A3E01_19570 [Gammaproteobacteria bacterium RIFCSPHIGHO2_12_FULL_63_22]